MKNQLFRYLTKTLVYFWAKYRPFLYHFNLFLKFKIYFNSELKLTSWRFGLELGLTSWNSSFNSNNSLRPNSECRVWFLLKLSCSCWKLELKQLNAKTTTKKIATLWIKPLLAWKIYRSFSMKLMIKMLVALPKIQFNLLTRYYGTSIISTTPATIPVSLLRPCQFYANYWLKLETFIRIVLIGIGIMKRVIKIIIIALFPSIVGWPSSANIVRRSPWRLVRAIWLWPRILIVGELWWVRLLISLRLEILNYHEMN